MKTIQLHLKRGNTHMNSSILAMCFLVMSATWSFAQQVKVSAPAVTRTRDRTRNSEPFRAEVALDVRPQSGARSPLCSMNRQPSFTWEQPC